MSDLIKIEAPELNIIEESKAKQIKATFEPMAEMLEEFESAFNEIVSESNEEITKDLTARAKRLRLDIGQVRIQTEKIRKEQKEEYLRAGKAIDGVSNILKWAVTDKENKLKEIENYFEIQEQKRLEALQIERVEMLSKYVDDAEERNLSDMAEDVWEAYYQSKKKAWEDEQAAIKKAEEERIERERKQKLHEERKSSILDLWQFVLPELRDIDFSEVEHWNAFVDELKAAKEKHEAEQESIRKENERLQKEREEAEKKAESERKAREEKERKEREAYEAKLKAERAERERIEREERQKREKLEAELKAKAEAERKAKEEEESRLQAELNKGDADKVKDLISDLEALKTKYTFKSAKNKKMYKDVGLLIDRIINHI